MTIVIRPPQDAQEVRQIEDVQRAAWGMDDRTIAPYHVFHAWMHAGGVVLGAFDGTRMVGFAAGFLGESQGKRVHWSHLTAVIPEYRRQGIGKQLKLTQREAVLAQGLDIIAWTYDPLQMRNAALNINALGAACQHMYFEMYGQMPDEVNRARLSDRFEVHWHLNSERVLARIAGHIPNEPPQNVILHLDKDRPVLALPESFDAPEYSAELPGDVEHLTPDLIQAWYYALRNTAVPLFEAGYSINRVFIPSDGSTFAYVFTRDDMWYLYVLETSKGTLYTGITTDIDRRVDDHNAGRGAKYTAARRPVRLLAAWRTYGRGKATQLERGLKRLSHQQKLKLIATNADFETAVRLR